LKLPLWLVKLFCTPHWQYSGKAANIVESVWRIYNETPIRQDRGFHHYGESLDSVAADFHKFDGDTVYVYPTSRTCVSKVCLRGCCEKHFGDGVFG